MNRKAFTLIELLAVIIILAMVSMVVVPNIVKAIDSSKMKSMVSISNLAVSNAKQYINNNLNFSLPTASGDVKLITFNEIGLDTSETPYGDAIDLNNSYVLVDNSNNYYVTITTAIGKKGLKNILSTEVEGLDSVIEFGTTATNHLEIPDVSTMSGTSVYLDADGNGILGDGTATIVEIRN